MSGIDLKIYGQKRKISADLNWRVDTVEEGKVTLWNTIVRRFGNILLWRKREKKEEKTSSIGPSWKQTDYCGISNFVSEEFVQ